MKICYYNDVVFEAQSRCNSTIQLDDRNQAVYINLVVNNRRQSSLSSSSSTPSSPQSSTTFSPTRSCPASFQARPGQRIAVTLYSFLQHSASGGLLVDGKSTGTAAADTLTAALASDGPALCLANTGSLTVSERGGSRDELDSPWSVRLCDIKHQHREQTLVTTNTSSAEIYYIDGGGDNEDDKVVRTGSAADGGTRGRDVTARWLKQMIATGWRYPIVYLVKVEG